MSESVPSDPSLSEPQFPGGEYAIDGVLGSGGMAVVYRARDLRRPRAVAIKMLRADVAKIIGTERFLREIAVTAAFTHPHILPLLDSGETTDAQGRRSPYYVMPLIVGEPLDDRLRKERRLPLQDAIRLTCEILEALRYAHEHGVIHRDIKPANVLLSGGHAVVADFGVARPMASANRVHGAGKAITEMGFIVGTPEYMSPEQALGDERVDERCDLYAVGCVLYEMIAGEPPFEAPTAQMIVSRKLSGTFEPITAMRSNLPIALDNVLSKALSAQPSGRYASAAEFLNDLMELDVRASASQAAARSAPRPFSPWMVAGVVGTIALVVAATLAWNRPKATRPDSLAPATAHARVAVLPLGVLAADSSLELVASALTGDLIDELARYPALTVISKNGVLPFQGTAARTDSVARTLNVGSIVTGDMRASGDSIRVTMRLIDGVSSAQLASMEARGVRRDLLALRSSIIDSVASFLRTQIGAEITRHSERTATSPEAWQLLARARAMGEGELARSGALSPGQRAAAFATVDSLLLRAIKLDPEWPDIAVFRATLRLLRATIEEVASPTSVSMVSELRMDAVRMTNEVLKRTPGFPTALFVRARARAALWRTSAVVAPDSLRMSAEADFREVVRQRRDLADAWNELSLLLQMSGAYTEARSAAEAALKADAFLRSAPAVISRLSFTSLAIGNRSEAVEWCNRGRAQYPRDPRFWGCDLTLMGWAGKTRADVDEAWRLLAASEARDSANLLVSGAGTRRLLVAAVAARAGLSDSALAIARRVRDSLPAGAPSSAVDYGEAYVHALLGHDDQAITLLESYLRANPALRGQVRQSPWFATLRTTPRFQAITAP
ncbi:MAG: protein kinase [Gemmatimonadaceae bacterium]|nr:protein kinase [Gemmatimonadaceae bacterium]